MVRAFGRFRLVVLAVVLAALGQFVYAASAPTAPWREHPYDPRPLMERAGPEKTGPYTFAVFGDSYANPELKPLLDMVAAKSPTFVVTTGDMVSKGGDEHAWQRLNDRAGTFMRRFPTWPTIGNHELADGGAPTFEGFYHLPSGSYSFTFRGSKFLLLDHTGTAPKDQIAFLTRELADRAKYEHVFVFRHSPFYTVGSKSRDEVPDKPTAETELLSREHVTGVFSGHDHTYYRTRRDGVDYIVAGSAGAGVYSLMRLKEQTPGDAYMGRSSEGNAYVLHVPGKKDRTVPHPRDGDWVFAVFVHVDGEKVTAETVSVRGEVWEQFELP